MKSNAPSAIGEVGPVDELQVDVVPVSDGLSRALQHPGRNVEAVILRHLVGDAERHTASSAADLGDHALGPTKGRM